MSILSVPDEGYSRNAVCALNLEYYNNVFENVFFIVFLLFVCCGYFMSNPFIVYLLKKYICLKFEDELKLVFVFERQS
jgi:hypothetical protein